MFDLFKHRTWQTKEQIYSKKYMYVLLSVLKIVNLTCIDAKHLKQNKQRLKKTATSYPVPPQNFLYYQEIPWFDLSLEPLTVRRVTEDRARGERDLYVQLKTTAVTDCPNPELALVSEQAVLHRGQGHD